MCEGFRWLPETVKFELMLKEWCGWADSGAGFLDRRSVPRHWVWEWGATREPQEPLRCSGTGSVKGGDKAAERDLEC